MNREPALVIGAFGAVVNAALVALFTFWGDVTPDQKNAIFTLATAVIGLVGVVTALITRTQVTPVTKVERKLERAHEVGTQGETLQLEA